MRRVKGATIARVINWGREAEAQSTHAEGVEVLELGVTVATAMPRAWAPNMVRPSSSKRLSVP